MISGSECRAMEDRKDRVESGEKELDGDVLLLVNLSHLLQRGEETSP